MLHLDFVHFGSLFPRLVNGLSFVKTCQSSGPCHLDSGLEGVVTISEVHLADIEDKQTKTTCKKQGILSKDIAL